MNDYQSDENLKVMQVLLEKAEQILSIINLSDGIIRKYNQLKEMTYDKLGLNFVPLIRKSLDNNSQNNRERETNYNFIWDLINKTRAMNFKKNLIIEFLFDLIEKFKFENNNGVRQIIEEIENSFENNLDKIHNFNSNLLFNKHTEDLEFDLKMEEIKLRDFLGKSEISYKKFLANLKYTQNYNFGSNSNKFITNEENATVTNCEELIRDYERKIEEISRSHERDLKEFRDRFNELRIKYNPEIDNEFHKLKNDFNDLQFIIEKVNDMVIPLHEKHYQKNSSWYENEKIDYKFVELEKINFVISLVNKFFSDNKYLIDLVSSLQKEKLCLIEERNLPFVINSIQNNNLLYEIYEDTKMVENQSEDFNRNFEQVIDYIKKNLEINK